jgi:23S rRNA pseudouridine955/2504/2580 synthase
MRIDRWTRLKIGKIPQGLIEKYLRSGKIKINKKKIKSSTKVKTNDIVNFFNLDFKETIVQKKIKFEPSKEIIKSNEDQIIDNNENFVVLNKSSGISVQGGTKSKKNLVDIFAKSEIFHGTKPYSVHRLDKDTSGVFIMAKTRESAQLLTSLFRLRKVHKTYLAICHGELNTDEGEWNDDLIRYDGDKKIIEKAKTIFKVLDKNSEASLVELKPITGRKHQLRKQLYALGQPIFGDIKYKLSNSSRGVKQEFNASFISD